MICRLCSFTEDVQVQSLHLNKEPPNKTDALQNPVGVGWEGRVERYRPSRERKLFVGIVLPIKEMFETSIPETCDHALWESLFSNMMFVLHSVLTYQ